MTEHSFPESATLPKFDARTALLAAREYIGDDNNPKSNRALSLIALALDGLRSPVEAATSSVLAADEMLKTAAELRAGGGCNAIQQAIMWERKAAALTGDVAQSPKLWPDIKELHDVIAGQIERQGLSYSSIRAAAEGVQKLYASTLSSTEVEAPISGSESCTCHFLGAGTHHVPGCPFYTIATSLSRPQRETPGA